MCVMAYLITTDLDIGVIPINVKVTEVNPNLRENN